MALSCLKRQVPLTNNNRPYFKILLLIREQIPFLRIFQWLDINLARYHQTCGSTKCFKFIIDQFNVDCWREALWSGREGDFETSEVSYCLSTYNKTCLKRTSSKADKTFCPKISVYWSKSHKHNLSKAETYLKRTKILVPKVSALDRFHCR